MKIFNKIIKKILEIVTALERFVQYGDLPTSYYVKNGMKVGNRFSRQSGTRMDISNCWLIEIGNNVTLANRVQLLAHDDSAEQWCGYRKVGKIVIKDNVFIGAGSTVLPGVIIGENSIIGAGSLVNKSIPSNTVAAGVPIRIIKPLDQYLNEINEDLNKAKEEGRILPIEYDITCKCNQNPNTLKLKDNTRYYFKIHRNCDNV